MMYNLIPILIIILSLFIIIFLIVRKIPEIEKETEKKEVKELSEEDILKPDGVKVKIKKSLFARIKKRLQEKRLKEEERNWARSMTPPPKPKTILVKTKEAEKEKKKPWFFYPKDTLKMAVSPLKKGASLGGQFFLKKRRERQEREILNELDIRPNDYQLLKELSQMYLKRRKYERAAEVLRRIIEVKPNDFSTYGDFGFVSLKLNNYSDAIEAYKVAVDHDSKNIEYLENLALIAEKLDNIPMLKSTLERLLEISPQDRRIRNRLKELEKQSKLL